MTTRREQIISKALEFLKGNPNGIRYSKLVNMIKDSLREIQVKSNNFERRTTRKGTISILLDGARNSPCKCKSLF